MGHLITALVLLASPGELSPDGMSRYQKANVAIGGAQYRAAIELLNGLAAEAPKVAEVFAARCSALVGLKSYAAAEADCTYALAIKPELHAARYALAIAQEYQGKRDAAIQNYRQYAALDEKLAPYRTAALARADALAAVPAATPPPPPMVATAGGEPKLVVYKNHVGSVGRLMLVLDGKLVGDLSMDEYVEIEAAPGEHMLEARTYVTSAYDRPRVWNRPVQLGNGTVFVNFDTKSGQMVMQEVSASLAKTDIKTDCKKAYSRTIGPDSTSAPELNAPANGVVAAWPGGAVVIAPGTGAPVTGVRTCRFSSDCGDGSDFSCRSWRGQQVCMGRGGYGSPCWFSSDCVSNSCDGSNKVCR